MIISGLKNRFAMQIDGFRTILRFAQGFSRKLAYLMWGSHLKAEDARAAIKAVAEANEERRRLLGTLNDNGAVASDASKLFREGNDSRLMKVGMAVIAIPEPTPVSPLVGASLVAAGAVQKRIKNRAAFAEDIGKDFKKSLRELSRMKDQIRI